MEKRNFERKILIPVLLLITAVAVSVTIWALFFRSNAPVLAPDYAPKEEEPYAQTIPDDSDEKMDQPSGGGSVSLTYSKAVTVDLAKGTASLYFANPGKSNQDIVLQVVVQDTVIVQSGTLKPGHQITNLELLDGAEKRLAPGGYEGKFVVYYYHPETAEKAVINTEIPITITVA